MFLYFIIFSTKGGGGGVRPLVENSTIFFIFFETLPKTVLKFSIRFNSHLVEHGDI